MADHASALKRQRQNEKRNARNRATRSKIKTLIKKVEKAANKQDGLKTLKEAISCISKAAQKGVFHKNNASRKISQLTRLVNKLAS